jgi:hypothetical protein
MAGSNSAINRYEGVVLSDPEKRCSRDGHIAVQALAVIQLDDRFTWNEFALQVKLDWNI